MAKKKGDGKKQKQQAAHDPNRNHQAHAKDTAQVLRRAVQSSGLNGAEIVAKKLDEQGRQGTSTLEKLKTHHRETDLETGRLVWSPFPAEWMRRAVALQRCPMPAARPSGRLMGRALRRHMRRLRLKQLEMKKAQVQQSATPPAQETQQPPAQ